MKAKAGAAVALELMPFPMRYELPASSIELENPAMGGQRPAVGQHNQSEYTLLVL